MALAQVASRSKAPEDRAYNLPPLEKQKDDRIMDEWMQRQRDGRTKRRKENTKEIKVLFALLVFIKLDTWRKIE
jgi:hypothetical protein